MNIFPKPRRSFMEPTLLTCPQIPDCETTLLHAYSQLAKAQTHKQLVTTCLQSNTIPWGLRINTKPQVPLLPDEATCTCVSWNSYTNIGHKFCGGHQPTCLGPKRISQEMWTTSGTIHLNRKELGCSVARTVEVRRYPWIRKDKIQSEETRFRGETSKKARLS